MKNIPNLIDILKEISFHKKKLKELELTKINILTKIFNNNEKELSTINIFNIKTTKISSKNDEINEIELELESE